MGVLKSDDFWIARIVLQTALARRPPSCGEADRHHDDACAGGDQRDVFVKPRDLILTGQTSALNLDFAAQLDHGVIRQIQEVSCRSCIAVHLGKKLLAPLRHAATHRWHDGVAR